MQLPLDTALQRRLAVWARYLITGTAIVAILSLLGWQYDIEVFRTWNQGQAAMNPGTAVCFLLLVLALSTQVRMSYSRRQQLLTMIPIALVFIFTVVFLVLRASGTDPEWDLLLWRDKLVIGASKPWRMSLPALLNFVLISVATYGLSFRGTRRGRLAHLALIPTVTIGIFSLLSYLYNDGGYMEVAIFKPMAVHTGVCFLLLSLAILFLTSNQGFMRQLTSDLSGSSVARVLVPAAIMVPALLGFFRLWGFRQGMFSYEFGIALLTIATMIAFIAIVWYSTVAMNRREIQRLQAERARLSSEEQVKAIFTSAPEGIALMDREGRLVQWNPAAEKLFGWSSAEVLGQHLGDVIIPAESREVHRKVLDEFLGGEEMNEAGHTAEIQAIHKNMHPVDISLSVSPLIRDESPYMIVFIRNITEKKKIEQKLKTFNDELSAQVQAKTREVTDVFERVTDGFIALDKEFRYTFVNTRAGNMIGLEPSSLIGKRVWEIFPDAVGSPTYQAFNTAMKTQEFMTNTDYFEPLDLWQENHIYPSPNGLSIFIRDISNQKRAEKIISDARNLADRLIDSLPGVFYFYDEQGNFLKWNKQFEEVTGYTADEISDMHPLQFFAPADHAYMSSRIGEVFRTQVADAEASFLSKRGEMIPYYFRATLMMYQGKPCLLGTGINIAERKKAEANLKASEQKYKTLFDNNPMPMWMVNLPDYSVVDANASLLRKFKYGRDEFLDLDLRKLVRQEPITIDGSFRGETQVGVVEMIDKKGGQIFMDIVTDDLYFQGKPVRLALLNDVTEQHLSKEKLAESYESIRQLTEYLQNIREEERMHISREIHDELGQLLTVLKMDVSWLNKKIDAPEGPVKAKINELLALIDTTVKTVRRIASELRPTLLDDLGIQAAMEWHLEEFERRSGIVQTFDPPGMEIEIPDNLKIGLFRIFQESLTNVARHSGSKNVHVSLKKMDNDVILTVVDEGHGFDEEKTKKKTLGLLGMKERSNVMGGEYSISSIPGSGTTVRVVVPVPVAKTTA